MQDWDLKPARDIDLAGAERHRSYRRESGLVENFARFLWWSKVRLLLKLVNRLEVHGQENLPAEPSFVLVANHASHLDALVLASALPLRLRDHIFPLAAGDVFFETPAFAAFSAIVLNALPVWRKNCGAHAIKDLRSRLVDEPSIYILFPEGGRSRDGSMRPFKPGVGMMTAGTPVPVVPCYLDGTYEAFPPHRRLPRLKKISVRFGEAHYCQDYSNSRDGWKAIAQTLESDVRWLAEQCEV